MVPGFIHVPGVHCGSTAFTDAARFIGLDWSEDLVFGLAGGIAFYLFEVDVQSPSKLFHGRTGSFDDNFVQSTKLDLAVRGTQDFDEAFTDIRALIDGGEPVLLKTDLRFLPYYQSAAEFNGHKVVLAGYDPARQEVLLADTHFRRVMPLSYADLERTMTSAGAPLFWKECRYGPLRRSDDERPLTEAVPDALRRASALMLDEPSGFGGLEALARMADGIGAWRHQKDATWIARFGYQVIEKRGSGGGLFRRMYARFLDEARAHADIPSDLSNQMRALADMWTALAQILKRAATQGGEAAWDEAVPLTRRIYDAEHRYHHQVAAL